MSLFPAYAAGAGGGAATSGVDVLPEDQSKDPREGETDVTRDWLQLQSFPSRSSPLPPPRERLSRSSSRSPPPRRRRSSSLSSPERTVKRRRRRRSSSSSSPRRRRRKRDKKDRKKSKKKSREISPPPPSREELLIKYSAGKTFLDEVGVRPEVAFKVDSDADKKLLLSGYSSAPKAVYKLAFKMPLGTSWRARQGDKKSPRFFQKSYLRRFLSDEGVLSLTKQQSYAEADDGEGMDEIPIATESRSLQEVNSDIHDPLKVYDSATSAYLSGKGKEVDKEAESFKLHYIQERTKDFNEKLRQNPFDVDLWLKFVEFQNVSFEETDFSPAPDDKEGKKKKKAAGKNVILKQTALVEKKLSIIKAALDKNPKSLTLSIRRLHLSREIMETSVLDRQWKELIFLFPKNFELWRFYLRFVSTYFTSFSVSKVLKAYRTCFSKLKQVQAQSFLSAERPEDLEDQMRVILADLCHFLASAGFREKGLALFQAMVEFNLFSPDFPGYYALEDKLALFEPFWESGVPRFGEVRMQGWATVIKNKEKAAEEAIGTRRATDQENPWEDEMLSQAGELVDRKSLWLELELNRERRHWSPWRSSEEDAEDPDRAVGYEDLAPFLFQFAERDQKLKLVLSFLHFLGVDVDDRRQGFFPYVALSSVLGLDSTETSSVDVDWSPDILAPVLQSTVPDYVEDESLQEFCRSVFSHASKALDNRSRTQLVGLWLHFEMSVAEKSSKIATSAARKAKAKEIKALVKNILLDDQDNLAIYVHYARTEYRIDGFKGAWKILQTMLMSDSKNAQKLRPWLYVSVISVALLDLKNCNDERERTSKAELCLWLLSMATKNAPFEPLSSASKLKLLELGAKSREQAEKDVHYCLMSGKISSPEEEIEFKSSPVDFVPRFVAKLFICVWLQYFIEEEGYRVAAEFIDFAFEKLKALPAEPSTVITLVKENIHKLRLDLLSLASWNNRLLLRDARLHLSQALQNFPNSPHFLQGLLDFHIRPSVIDLTWRVFVNMVLSSNLRSSAPVIAATKVLVRHFVICQQESCSSDATDNSVAALAYLNRAKYLLEQAVMREPARYSALVWRLLMWVTHMLAQLRKSQSSLEVNTIFYRAVQDCPAKKALYLDVVKYLHVNSTSSCEEMQKVIETLTEKEGRIRLPMEELDILLEKEEEEDGLESDDGD